MNILKTSACTACILALSLPTALAADISIVERIDRSWYATAAVGPEVLVLDFDDGNATDAVANTYWGVGGTAEVCKAGVGSAEWLDLCAGAHLFKSLGGASQTIAARIGGGTSETDVLSYGGFVKAKAHMGILTFAPYVGLRQINVDISSSNALVAARDTDSSAFFGGAELGIKTFNERLEWGLGGELGQSNSGEDFTYYKGGGFLRLSF